MKYFEVETVKDILSNIKNGTFTRIGYSSEVDLRKPFYNNGYRIFKIVEENVQIGVNYKNIKAVKEYYADVDTPSEKSHTSNYTWVIPNKVAYNSKTEREYVRVTRNKNSHKKVQYLVYDATAEEWKTLTKEEVVASYSDMLKASFFSEGSSSALNGVVKNIHIENIYKIGKVVA